MKPTGWQQPTSRDRWLMDLSWRTDIGGDVKAWLPATFMGDRCVDCNEIPGAGGGPIGGTGRELPPNTWEEHEKAQMWCECLLEDLLRGNTMMLDHGT